MPFNPPSIRYVRTSDGLDIAYWKLGRGPVLLHSPNVQFGHAQSEWSVDGMRRWYESLARHFTVVRYDHRGGGLSSRDGGAQSINALVHDINAIAERVSRIPSCCWDGSVAVCPQSPGRRRTRHAYRISYCGAASLATPPTDRHPA